MRVLGIDPGSRFCGFGVVEEAGAGRVKHLAHGVVTLDGDAPLHERLVELHRALAAELQRFGPQVVAVEDVHYAQNARSALVLGQARGVALLAAAQSGAQVRSFAPTVIKQAVTGSGRADKLQVGRMVEVLLGVRIEERADASDALAAAVCGLLRGREPQAAAVQDPDSPNAVLRRLLAGARRRTSR